MERTLAAAAQNWGAHGDSHGILVRGRPAVRASPRVLTRFAETDG
jgi:hypothetical protein